MNTNSTLSENENNESSLVNINLDLNNNVHNSFSQRQQERKKSSLIQITKKRKKDSYIEVYRDKMNYDNSREELNLHSSKIHRGSHLKEDCEAKGCKCFENLDNQSYIQALKRNSRKASATLIGVKMEASDRSIEKERKSSIPTNYYENNIYIQNKSNDDDKENRRQNEKFGNSAHPVPKKTT
jgi:hypothetical protein